MFSSAFKSFTSNISANYDISKQSIATAGAWTIFDAKKKSTGAHASVFVFKRESLDGPSGGLGVRVSATSIRKAQDEVVERLRKEASSLARLRHPSILQLVEPVEETRSGGLMFATEPVLASLSGALTQKDRKEPPTSRPRSDWDEGVSRALKDVELDELEIQKGLLQVAKGLEFMHESAKLVHGNLNPDAIFINAKSDWKISGLAFSGPPDGAEGHQPVPQISLSEALHNDPRIPRFVQLNLDYTSPDFVLDTNITFSADMFSLGLILLACYRTPHTSPIETNGNQSTYRKLCSSTSTVPNPSNNYMCSNSLPTELAQTLPRILARRPAQRMSASEFQQSEYFDNILVNTMRFLDALPAKTPAEKSQFMRGLGRVMPQFPRSILGKKVLSALLDEMKDRELLASILQNIFQLVKLLPDGKEAVSDKVLPGIKDVFLSKTKSEERDTSKEAALMVVLENIQLIAQHCTAKQFKDDALPIVHVAMESTTHSVTDAALQTLPAVLPLLDFSTVKHELFPVVANVFAKTSSLSIKVQGLEALSVLCGVPGPGRSKGTDDLSGAIEPEKADKGVSSLDKFTMQEKVVPLLKAIKTREPAVMMAALKVLRQVGQVADIEFLAMEVMPTLWSFGLGPLLDLTQFRTYMEVIKSLSAKIEREQTRKLQELGSNKPSEARNVPGVLSPVSSASGRGFDANGAPDDFEKLVIGNKAEKRNDAFAGALTDGQRLTQNPPTFSWTSSNSSGGGATTAMSVLQPQLQPVSRSVTPDVAMSTFPTLQPSSSASGSIWGGTSPPLNPLASARPVQAPNYSSTFSIPGPPQPSNTWQTQPPIVPNQSSGVSWTPFLPPPPSNPGLSNTQSLAGASRILQPQSSVQRSVPTPPPPQNQQQPKSGLDKYQSLL